jgi:hypothetical protein
MIYFHPSKCPRLDSRGSERKKCVNLLPSLPFKISMVIHKFLNKRLKNNNISYG